jgi:thiamine biosynthesis lipoprotein
MMGHVPVNVTIQISPAQKEKALLASEKAYALAQSLEEKISEYQPKSEVSCLNREAGKGDCLLSPETLNLLKFGMEITSKTQGAFDLRFGSLSPEGRKGNLVIDGNRARLSNRDTRIGVGSIGKGLIIDALIDYFRHEGFTKVLVDAGGDLRALGGPWKVAIQTPEGAVGQVSKTFEIRDQALATSGNYEQPGHIIDPRSGKKVIHSSSVTVLADRHMLANGLSTAFYVMGEEESALALRNFPAIQMTWTHADGAFSTYGPFSAPETGGASK